MPEIQFVGVTVSCKSKEKNDSGRAGNPSLGCVNNGSPRRGCRYLISLALGRNIDGDFPGGFKGHFFLIPLAVSVFLFPHAGLF